LKTHDNSGPKKAETKDGLTDSQIQEFEALFLDWLESGSNREAIESGGAGTISDLARRARAWTLNAGSQ
jgi:hypothetical protein